MTSQPSRKKTFFLTIVSNRFTSKHQIYVFGDFNAFKLSCFSFCQNQYFVENLRQNVSRKTKTIFAIFDAPVLSDEKKCCLSTSSSSEAKVKIKFLSQRQSFTCFGFGFGLAAPIRNCKLHAQVKTDDSRTPVD